jgi:hypothetical protein
VTDTPSPNSLRERIDAAIRPAMLISLQDAELHDQPGHERIGEWADSITEWVLAAVQPELDTITAVARTNALAEAADHLDRIADEVEAKVAAYYGEASGIGPGSAGHVRMDAKSIRALAGIEPAEEPIVASWDRAVIHPDDPTEPTIVCCRTDGGKPVALVLDPEHREALGLQLIDPDGH